MKSLAKYLKRRGLANTITDLQALCLERAFSTPSQTSYIRWLHNYHVLARTLSDLDNPKPEDLS